METCGSCTIIPRNKGNDYHSVEAHRGRVEEGRIHQRCQCHRHRRTLDRPPRALVFLHSLAIRWALLCVRHHSQH